MDTKTHCTVFHTRYSCLHKSKALRLMKVIKRLRMIVLMKVPYHVT
jgi:hypothetical protein